MIISNDTIRCKLRDEKGIPRRQGVSYYQYSFHIDDLQLQQDDSIQVDIRHDMKREMLPGIGDVGILMKHYWLRANEVSSRINSQEDKQ